MQTVCIKVDNIIKYLPESEKISNHSYFKIPHQYRSPPSCPCFSQSAVTGAQQPVLTLSRSVLDSQRYGRQTHSKLPHLRLYLTSLAFQFFPKSVNIAFLGIKFSHNRFKHSVREFPNSLFSESLMLQKFLLFVVCHQVFLRCNRAVRTLSCWESCRGEILCQL